MRVKHLGSGVVLFENAAEIDKSILSEFLSGVEKNATPQGYSESVDKKDVVISDGGYEYEQGELAVAPTRYIQYLYEGMPEEHRQFAISLEDALYQCVVYYMRLFPVALACVRWRTRGYIIKYTPGQNIGPHTDNDLPYGDDPIVPLLEFPLSNTITSGLILNDGYDGGDIEFASWGIKVSPKMGDAIFYSSSFCGCHQVNAVTNGVRYAYLQWFSQGSPNNMARPSTEVLSPIQHIPNLHHDVCGDARGDFRKPRMIPVGYADWVQGETPSGYLTGEGGE